MTANRSYTKEYKEKIIRSLQPPENKRIPQIAKEENISKNTIYTWVSKARKEGKMLPNSNPSNELK